MSKPKYEKMTCCQANGHNYQVLGSGFYGALGTYLGPPPEPTKAFCTRCGKVIKLGEA